SFSDIIIKCERQHSHNFKPGMPPLTYLLRNTLMICVLDPIPRNQRIALRQFRLLALGGIQVEESTRRIGKRLQTLRGPWIHEIKFDALFEVDRIRIMCAIHDNPRIERIFGRRTMAFTGEFSLTEIPSAHEVILKTRAHN